MTEHRRQLPSSARRGTAWGHSHLALDAIVAFVDEELSPGARGRALAHLSGCIQCASEVVAQTQARLALRAAAAPCLPSSLMSSLRNIPTHAELPAPPAGLAVGPEGELVTVLRPTATDTATRRRPSDRRMRLGAGAVVSGLAFGALMVTGGADDAPEVAGADLRPAVDASLQLGRVPREGGATPAAGSIPGPVSGPVRGSVPAAQYPADRPGTAPVPAVVPAISLPR